MKATKAIFSPSLGKEGGEKISKKKGKKKREDMLGRISGRPCFAKNMKQRKEKKDLSTHLTYYY